MMDDKSKRLRLDQFVVEQHPNLSRSYAHHLIMSGLVTVNDKSILKAGYKVKPTDSVEISYNPEQVIDIPSIELDIIYEDDDCVVIDKPIGVLSHSKGVFNPEATVASWLSHRINSDGFSVLPDNEDNDRLGIVHRLDRATSGIMICAKNHQTVEYLQKQFAKRKVQKTYIAIISGALKDETMVIDMPIERNPKKPHSFRVGSNGKSAITECQQIKSGSKYSIVELKPLTGRTHQLRVHLTTVGNPILGDDLYGGDEADRLYLHSYSLEITLPDSKSKTFIAKKPTSFDKILHND